MTMCDAGGRQGGGLTIWKFAVLKRPRSALEKKEIQGTVNRAQHHKVGGEAIRATEACPDRNVASAGSEKELEKDHESRLRKGGG